MKLIVPVRSFLQRLYSWWTAQSLCVGSKGILGLVPLTVRLDQFQTHLYVVGQSGQGKSKFLQHLLFQLTSTNWGCGLFDPHADLASDLLAQLASYPQAKPWLSIPSNQERLIYLDPSRSDALIPCNILCNSSCTAYEIAENVVESFRRVWPETLAEAPRFAQILRSACLVLALNKLTLLELEPLLTSKSFRDKLLAQTPDPQVVSFFHNQYDQWGRDQPIFAAPVLNKVSAFLFKPHVRLMLGANENHLDLRRIIDEGKILIVNLGGFHDEETQRLLGSLLVTSLEQAAFSRSNQDPKARRPFFCMIDEFPLFCSRDSTSLARILSECRKYRLHLGLAHQTITQLPGERIQGALENAKFKVIFGTGRQTAQAIVGDLFMPNPQAIKHKVEDKDVQDRTHPVFNPLNEQFEVFTQKIQRLRKRKVLVKLPDKSAVKTVRVPNVPASRIRRDELENIKSHLAQMRGLSVATLNDQITARQKQFQVPVEHPTRPSAGTESHSEFWA